MYCKHGIDKQEVEMRLVSIFQKHWCVRTRMLVETCGQQLHILVLTCSLLNAAWRTSSRT